MRSIMISFSAMAFAAGAGACVTADPVDNAQPAEHRARPQPQADTSSAIDKTQTSNVELAKQCAVYFADQQHAPRFDYDRFQLLPEDRNVLDRVATCMTSGSFQGHKIHLIGHADPRGTAAYNLALGDRRARAVVDYLQRAGVDTSQVITSTRGALDASGRDENSWQLDRRVELKLQP